MNRAIYEWLETEIFKIKTPNFHVIEGDKKLYISEELFSCLPPSYKVFINKFGGAKLYRRNNYYEVGVLNQPQEETLNNGEKILRVGHFDDAKAYLICSQLIVGRESPIYEWCEDGFEKIADSFEEWLIRRCTDVRESYDAEEWQQILSGNHPFTSDERAILEARKRFQWQVVGFEQDKIVKITVRNNSNLVLQYLTIGMKTKNPTQNGQIWESGIYLNVSNIFTLNVSYPIIKLITLVGILENLQKNCLKNLLIVLILSMYINY